MAEIGPLTVRVKVVVVGAAGKKRRAILYFVAKLLGIEIDIKRVY